MKKLCVCMVVVFLTVGFMSVAAAEKAETEPDALLLKLEHFTQKGSYRVRWYNNNNMRDFDDETNDNENYFDQRLRLKGKYEPVQNYSLNYRVDITEGTWGDDFGGGISNRPSEDVEFQIDQLYMRLNPEVFTLNIGLHMVSWAHMWVFEPRATGATMRLRSMDPLLVDLHYGKRSEGGSIYDEDGYEDEDLYGAQLMYKTDKLWVCAYYAALNDKAGATTTDDQATYDTSDDVTTLNDDDILRQAIGFGVHAAAGKLQFNGELTFFSGENKKTDVDYVGTQVVAEGIYRVKSFRIGARIYYAQAADDDEAQLTNIQIADPHASFLMGMGKYFERDLPEITGVAHNTDSSPASFYRSVFDPSAQGAGVIGGGIYAYYSPFDKLDLSAGMTYLTPEDDDKTDLDGNPVELEDLTVANLGAKYTFFKNLNAAVGMSYWRPETESGENEDVSFTIAAQVNFLF